MPRYLMYPNATALPVIALGLNNASNNGSVLRDYLPSLRDVFNLRQPLKVSQ